MMTVVASFELLHELADLFDDAGGFVSKNAGRLERVETLDKVQVGMADAGCRRFDQYFARAWLGDINVFDRQILMWAVEDGSFHRDILSGHGACSVACSRRRAAQSSASKVRSGKWCRERGSNPHGRRASGFFKSAASANSAIPAWRHARQM